MKKEQYILFSELGEHQKKHPGVFPVFKKIHQIDGQLIGEAKAYSDEFGNQFKEGVFSKKTIH